MAVIRKLETQQEEQYQPERLPPKRNHAAHDDSNWLISYADMMTLLCVFYIMLFSMSTVKTNEFEKVKKQVAEHFGQHYVSPTEDLGKFMTNVIQEAGVQKDTTISSDGTSVSIVLHSTLLFGSMSAEISKEGDAIMKKIIVSLGEKQKQLGKQYKVVIEGHTDSQPILGGPFPSNWELSSSRATRVVRMFLDNGYMAGNLLAIGYADTQPVAPSRNPDGTWNEANLSKNRRVVLRVLLPEVDSIPWSGVAKPNPNTAAPSTAPVKHVAAKPAVATAVAPAVTAPVTAPATVPTSTNQQPVKVVAPETPALAQPVSVQVPAVPVVAQPLAPPAAQVPLQPVTNGQTMPVAPKTAP